MAINPASAKDFLSKSTSLSKSTTKKPKKKIDYLQTPCDVCIVFRATPNRLGVLLITRNVAVHNYLRSEDSVLEGAILGRDCGVGGAGGVGPGSAESTSNSISNSISDTIFDNERL